MIKLLISALFALGLFLGAWKMAEHALWERRTGKASLAWPSVEGSVIQSGFRTAGSGTKRTTSAEIQYSYSVGGESYQNDRIRFGAHGAGSGPGRWGDFGRMSPGEPLTVFYDPQSPQQATLETGPTGRSLGLLAAAGVVALFGGFLLRVGWVAARK